MIAPRSAEHPARRPIDRPPRGKKHAGHEGSFLSARQLFEQSRRSLQSLLGVVRRDLVKGQASGRRPTHRVRDLTSCGERHYIAAGCVAQYRAKPCAPADPHGRRCAGCWCALPDVGGHSFDGRERVRPHPVFLRRGRLHRRQRTRACLGGEDGAWSGWCGRWLPSSPARTSAPTWPPRSSIDTRRHNPEWYRGHVPSAAGIPLGRQGHVDEIAATCLFLVSDDGAVITDKTIHVNGGAGYY